MKGTHAFFCRARATADAVKDEVVKHGAQLVYHVGDVAYANGSPAIWETFMALIDPYAKHAPYMVTVGKKYWARH